jgi:hypothetical protein
VKARLVGLALIASACAPAPVDIALSFPSEPTFLFSQFARLTVHPLAPGELGECPALLDAAMSGDDGMPALDSGRQPVCNFRNRLVRFGSVPAGPNAYVVMVFDQSNTTLLSGCRVAEAYDGAPRVIVSLYPTDNYATATAGQTPPFANEMAKCGAAP